MYDKAKSGSVLLMLLFLVFLFHPVRNVAEEPADLQRLGKLNKLSELNRTLKPGAHPGQMAAALFDINHWDKWKPRVNEEKPRGPAADVYADASPSVVVVRSEMGHGTGFIVDEGGWIITNHHVIAKAEIDDKTGARWATVHMGTLTNGFMKLDMEGIPAYVFASSEEKDLALLKLTKLPDTCLKVAALASQVPPPGAKCIVVGHPSAGILWTLRTGILSGVADWPRDMIQIVMAQLTIADADAKSLDEFLAKSPQKKVVLSTCGLNPGDSGGPLFNEKGEVIAVSFAIPTNDKASGVSLSKFSYHVHLDELKAFLKANKSTMEDKAAIPPIVVPSAWPLATQSGVYDFDGDGTEETRMFAVAGVGMTGLLMDLDQDSDLAALEEDPLTKDWDFEFAMQAIPHLQTFYDTNNDGHIDLVLIDTDADGEADVRLKNSGTTAATWKRDKIPAQSMLDLEAFEDEGMRERLSNIFVNIAELLEK